MIQPTQAMKDFFVSRTASHIKRVTSNMSVMAGYENFDRETLEKRGLLHDKSKWGEVERDSYIWLTEWHRCKTENIPFAFPKSVEVEVNKAMAHHKSINRHHPEAHTEPNAMENLDIIEMVADWKAMAQEFNEAGGSPLNWVKANISTWNFNGERQAFIFQTIEHMNKAYSQAELKSSEL